MKNKSMLECGIVALVVAAGLVGFAEPLAGQAGNGATLRAQQSSYQSPVARSITSVDPKVQIPKAAASDRVAVGCVERLELVGERGFIQSENVRGLLEPLLCDGTPKTLGDVKAAIVMAKNELSARGYYLVEIAPAGAGAYDPETKSITLAVEPGRFGDVKVSPKGEQEDGEWYSSGQVAKRFKYVKKGQPFNYRAFRQALLSLNGHPDLLADTKINVRKETEAEKREAQAEVSAADGTASDGASPLRPRYVDAAVSFEDSVPFHATLDVNNYAQEELDYWQMLLTLQYLNLTGVEDVLSVSPGITFNGDMWSIAASYMRPFDWLLGGSWSVYGGYSDMDCDKIVNRLDLEGIGGFVGLNSQWNLWDTERRNVSFNVGVMWRVLHDQWNLQGTDLSCRELHILPITAGFSYGDKTRDWLGGHDYLSISETFNLNVDQSQFDRYSEDADAGYAVLRGSWSRLQPLYGPSADGEEWRCWSLFQKVEGQWSQNYTLITSERLAYGGFNCLRGYRSRGYLGDNGLYATTEFRTPVFCNPVSQVLFPDMKNVLDRIQLSVFSDYGWLGYNDTVTPTMEKEEFLWSAGFGVRAALTKYFSVNFDLALPLRKCYAEDKDRNLELYFSIKLQY